MAIEHWHGEPADEPATGGAELRLVARPIPTFSTGAPVEQRRARRARRLARRRRSALAAGVVISLVILIWPGHAFGGVTASGVPVDLATSSQLASGTVYVVQSGDTVSTIASKVNPFSPNLARAALVRELRTSAIVPGERIVIP
jgi:hypothetical protein